MENQGFEAEHPSRSEGSTTMREPCHDSQAFPFELISNGSSSNVDGHVYEVILPSVENTSKHSGVSSIRQNPETPNTNRLRLPLNVADYISKEATTRSLDRDEIAGAFRRNLTLPFRRATGLDPSATSSSVRVNRKTSDDREEDTEVATWNAGLVVFSDDAFSFREISAVTPSTALQPECRPNRKRRKKDCKHCRSKAAAFANARELEADDRENETVLRKNRDNEQRLQVLDSSEPQTILDTRNFTTLAACSANRKVDELAITGSNTTSVFTISEKVEGSPASTMKFIERERSGSAETKEDNTLIRSERSRPSMRVNSIYSQDRWYAKGAPIFFTDVKEHGTFQRAYSLPMRTQTPSSQNRINLRRSVRGEPPPHPARLRKHRHGWTLHLAHPLEASGCTRSLILLLIALLVLVVIGAVALYIAFEPEKLEMIRQYLKSPTNHSLSNDQVLAVGTFRNRSNGEEWNDTSTMSATTPQKPSAIGTLAVSSILLNGDSSFPESGTPPVSEAETEATSPYSLNSTRYCDDCLQEEVCVALVDEEVPTCRTARDPEDPTGCAGFCLINKQKCHRLDVDAFRCVEMEHYCLDDEWTCLNTLCIPLKKHCDGHMNCYDHSDEQNCVCDLETHFQCGNETSCLPLEKRCDGKIDCWDATDEINCTLGRNLACPAENEFTCSNGQCILKARFCDNLPDCLDGSDEPHGCQGRCNKHEFTCQNSRCITKGMKCNGVDDCGDGTDERHCKDRFP
ncbi:PREDICTED: uncharacterized protein LOC108552304 isoform X2 [Eufriesea mexicana]|uniref:uncharacterized protein LOC108552304 isoform X2 n=1 Tax=Eufriesea mexicana TaxID=516756 RepID=UPI00083C463A|nr:PREDICTED: uncharacterized protein LOC108552304 isoform X2 [Eufriesea mexicana]